MSDRRDIQVVIFDVDDTLYPEREFVRSGYRAVATFLRNKLHRNDPFEDWLWERFLHGQTRGAFNALNEQFGLKFDAPALSRLVEIYRFHIPKLTPFEDIPPLLAVLKDSCRLGILTDGPAQMQMNKLKALGLLTFFDDQLVILTDSLGSECSKPNPTGFEQIAAHAAVPHSACAYIGDNPAKDFVAPNALGWRTIRYHRDHQVHAHNPTAPGGEPHIIVTSDEQLLAALRLQ